MRSYLTNPDKIYIHYIADYRKYPQQALYELASFLLWQGSQSYIGFPYSASGLPDFLRIAWTCLDPL